MYPLDPDDRFYGLRKFVPQASTYEGRDVRADQPWLTDRESDYCDQFDSIQESRMMRWILTPNFEIVEEPNMMRHALFMAKAPHRVIGDVHLRPLKWLDHERSINISTVFIGASPMTLFETMIFGGPLDLQKWCIDTLGGAKCQHQETVQLMRTTCNYLRRKNRGRTLRKAHKRCAKVIRDVQARGRDPRSCMNMLIHAHLLAMRCPGQPLMPSPNWLLEMALHYIPNPSRFNKHDVRRTTDTDSEDT